MLNKNEAYPYHKLLGLLDYRKEFYRSYEYLLDELCKKQVNTFDSLRDFARNLKQLNRLTRSKLSHIDFETADAHVQDKARDFRCELSAEGKSSGAILHLTTAAVAINSHLTDTEEREETTRRFINGPIKRELSRVRKERKKADYECSCEVSYLEAEYGG